MKQIQKLSALFVIALVLIGIAGQTSPTYAAVGFHISGRNLLDVNNNNFIIRGINHAHAWYPSNTASIADIKNTGKANAIRVVLTGGRWTPVNNAANVTSVINYCKSAKLVCILENHDTTGYGEQTGAVTLAQSVSYWQSIQSALTGQEAYVIINIGNEPFGNPTSSQWTQATKDAIIAMRNAGFQHTLMVDAPNWGQDWEFYMRNNAASVFAADTQANTIFSIHMYGVFDTAAEVQNYVNSFVSAGLPLVIGEFGNAHSDGDPDEDSIMSVAQANGIGYMGWSWSGNGGGVEYLDLVTGFNPAQITTWGNRLINGANGLSTTAVECSCYGSGPTNTPTRTPTKTNTPGGPTNTPTRTPTKTNTPGGPTNTPTRTPTPGTSSLKVQYKAADTGASVQAIKPYYIVVNTGGSSVPMSELKIRYWYTWEGASQTNQYSCYWTALPGQCANVNGSFVVVSPTRPGADYYLETGFLAGAGSVAAGGNTGEIQNGFNKSDWSYYTQTGDYSFDATKTAFADWNKVTLYRLGGLVWGVEP